MFRREISEENQSSAVLISLKKIGIIRSWDLERLRSLGFALNTTEFFHLFVLVSSCVLPHETQSIRMNSLRLLLFVLLQVLLGYACFKQLQVTDNLQAKGSNDMYVLYYRFPSFLQQLCLLCLIVLSFLQLILLLAYISTPLTQLIVYYEFFVLTSMFIALRQDGIENIPSLSRKLWWFTVYGFFFIHSGLNYVDQSSIDLHDYNKLYLVSLVSSGMLLFFSLFRCVYCPFKYQHFPPPVEYTSGLIEYVSFAYNNDLIRLGRLFKSLKLDQVPTLSDADSSKVLSDQLNSILRSLPSVEAPPPPERSAESIEEGKEDKQSNERNTKKESTLLRRSLFLLIWKEWSQQAFFQLIGSVSMFLSPLALETMLLYVKYQGKPQYIEESYLKISIYSAVFLLFLAPFFKSIGDGGNYVRGR